MNDIVGKKIRIDRGFYNQKEPWFATVVDIVSNPLFKQIKIHLHHKEDGHYSYMCLDELGYTFFIVEPENNTEIEE